MATHFSQEYLFNQNRKNGYTLEVKFKSETKSSNLASSIIVVNLKLDEKKLLTLVQNLYSEPKVNTYGVIKCLPYFDYSMDSRQKRHFEEFGFHTNEIADVVLIQDEEQVYKAKSKKPIVTLVV
jgi:hypothetical protein